MAKLKFQVDTDQKQTKLAQGMYSKEEEYVTFSEPCDCSGQVRWDVKETILLLQMRPCVCVFYSSCIGFFLWQ